MLIYFFPNTETKAKEKDKKKKETLMELNSVAGNRTPGFTELSNDFENVKC